MGGDMKQAGAVETARMLAWWLEAGVDTAVQESPRNWLRPSPPDPAPPAAPKVEASPQPEPVPETLDLFRDWLGRTEAMPLASATARRVLPHGPEEAPVMLIGDLTSEDAAEGRPIGGEAWALAERMLRAIGIEPAEVYSASLSCFHSPGAKIAAKDFEACAQLARRHIALARPKRLLLLGDAPSRALLGKPLTEARGHVHKVEGVRTIVTFHPRTLMQQMSSKRLAWADLLLLMEDDA